MDYRKIGSLIILYTMVVIFIGMYIGSNMYYDRYKAIENKYTKVRTERDVYKRMYKNFYDYIYNDREHEE